MVRDEHGSEEEERQECAGISAFRQFRFHFFLKEMERENEFGGEALESVEPAGPAVEEGAFKDQGVEQDDEGRRENPKPQTTLRAQGAGWSGEQLVHFEGGVIILGPQPAEQGGEPVGGLLDDQLQGFGSGAGEPGVYGGKIGGDLGPGELFFHESASAISHTAPLGLGHLKQSVQSSRDARRCRINREGRAALQADGQVALWRDQNGLGMRPRFQHDHGQTFAERGKHKRICVRVAGGLLCL